MNAGAVKPVKLLPKLYIAFGSPNEGIGKISEAVRKRGIETRWINRASGNPYLAPKSDGNHTTSDLSTSVYVGGINSDGSLVGGARIFSVKKGVGVPSKWSFKDLGMFFTPEHRDKAVEAVRTALGARGFDVGPVCQIVVDPNEPSLAKRAFYVEV